MSVKIGIVCEGISDYRVLKHITERYLREEDVYTIPLKPKETKQGRQDGFGSWQGVLEYIKGDDRMIIETAREGCSYIIVHIDTDVRDQYGLSRQFTDTESLHDDVVDMLSNHVHPDFDKSRLIFAVAIHETECWLISFLTDEKKQCVKTDSCVGVLNHHMKGEGYIDKDNKNSEGAVRVYEKILKNKKKIKDIRKASQHNVGFSRFIDTLDRIRIRLGGGAPSPRQ